MPGREFTVNIINEWFIEAANHTCGPYDPDVDEMELSGLTPVASEKVGPSEPRPQTTIPRCVSAPCDQYWSTAQGAVPTGCTQVTHVYI